ncbi:acyltransferase GLAUCE isoform X2 [Diospyros lotus]|uniref:acyltransferase GLAUCE isoform X2 n=1 Tax=Diospyros lotus TaxID=55363 RepID=UPI00225424B3|nr:acyltransferase GLAUCE isoform X2 [Diospyros lotus]
MGILHQEPLPLPDLRVTLEDTFLVFPSQETERKSIFLSNIDQVLNFDVQTVHFFPPHPDFPPSVVARKLQNALSEVLVPYSFLAGRLSLNKELGRLEIDCNSAGAGFVVASCQHSLDEIGDLVYPNPAFRQLIVQRLDKLGQHDQPLCIFQVTAFRCGGFAMGISTNHSTFDGLSFKMFLENLAAQAADKPLPIPPFNDRHLLAARSPPRVTFPHPELLKLKLPVGQDQAPPAFDCQEDDLDFQIFRLSSGEISSMKEKAKGSSATGVKVTGFNVVTAHLWRCKALSCDTGNLDRESTVLYAVDIRQRLVPALPRSYTGNAVLTAYATAACRELEAGPLGRLVEMVAGGAARMTDEYARSAIDWGEMHKGFPRGEFLISSWWRLGFGAVEYPWGKPRYSCPVVYHRKDIILLFPDMDDDGVNVLVALPAKEMELFKTFFHKFLLLEN